jgi:hypothetical protein
MPVTHAIDLRWTRPKTPPLSDEPAIVRIADVVTALRLHHPGVTGTTILWTHVGPDDAPSLRDLVRALGDARENRLTALARRRFDNAYERHNREDALVDLWIAFEALLVPDARAELRYRAALRIAR